MRRYFLRKFYKLSDKNKRFNEIMQDAIDSNILGDGGISNWRKIKLFARAPIAYSMRNWEGTKAAVQNQRNAKDQARLLLSKWARGDAGGFNVAEDALKKFQWGVKTFGYNHETKSSVKLETLSQSLLELTNLQNNINHLEEKGNLWQAHMRDIMSTLHASSKRRSSYLLDHLTPEEHRSLYERIVIDDPSFHYYDYRDFLHYLAIGIRRQDRGISDDIQRNANFLRIACEPRVTRRQFLMGDGNNVLVQSPIVDLMDNPHQFKIDPHHMSQTISLLDVPSYFDFLQPGELPPYTLKTFFALAFANAMSNDTPLGRDLEILSLNQTLQLAAPFCSATTSAGALMFGLVGGIQDAYYARNARERLDASARILGGFCNGVLDFSVRMSPTFGYINGITVNAFLRNVVRHPLAAVGDVYKFVRSIVDLRKTLTQRDSITSLGSELVELGQLKNTTEEDREYSQLYNFLYRDNQRVISGRVAVAISDTIESGMMIVCRFSWFVAGCSTLSGSFDALAWIPRLPTWVLRLADWVAPIMALIYFLFVYIAKKAKTSNDKHDRLEDLLGVETMIDTLMHSVAGLTYKDAKELVLESLGVTSGKMDELQLNVANYIDTKFRVLEHPDYSNHEEPIIRMNHRAPIIEMRNKLLKAMGTTQENFALTLASSWSKNVPRGATNLNSVLEQLQYNRECDRYHVNPVLMERRMSQLSEPELERGFVQDGLYKNLAEQDLGSDNMIPFASYDAEEPNLYEADVAKVRESRKRGRGMFGPMGF